MIQFWEEAAQAWSARSGSGTLSWRIISRSALFSTSIALDFSRSWTSIPC